MKPIRYIEEKPMTTKQIEGIVKRVRNEAIKRGYIPPPNMKYTKK